jgi:hypothetical protein
LAIDDLEQRVRAFLQTSISANNALSLIRSALKLMNALETTTTTTTPTTPTTTSTTTTVIAPTNTSKPSTTFLPISSTGVGGGSGSFFVGSHYVIDTCLDVLASQFAEVVESPELLELPYHLMLSLLKHESLVVYNEYQVKRQKVRNNKNNFLLILYPPTTQTGLSSRM